WTRGRRGGGRRGGGRGRRRRGRSLRGRRTLCAREGGREEGTADGLQHHERTNTDGMGQHDRRSLGGPPPKQDRGQPGEWTSPRPPGTKAARKNGRAL